MRLPTPQLVTLSSFLYHPLLRIIAFGGHLEITVSINLFHFEVATFTKTVT